jgi:CHAT domain/Cytosol aminopeptidase family, N-terminal domain/Lecithin:cholesterol acyltransferase
MGSKLGFDGIGPFDDVIWINPVAFVAGRLAELELKGVTKVEALGVILFAYLKLKLKLQINGHDAEFFAYDWRLSLDQLGKTLASEINSGARRTQVVAHSMGGLVARAALLHSPKQLRRVIMLGTPNFGSFSPLQSLRGVDSILQKLDFLDVTHSAADLAGIVGTFPGLCQQIPSPKKYPADFFNLASWPASGPKPTQAMLTDALKVQNKLPADFEDLVIIAGVDQPTAVDAKVVNGEFVFTNSAAGDGTVPLDCARLPTARKTYYVVEEHGSLPNNNEVARAVDAILQTGETSHLPDQYQPRRAAGLFEVKERSLRRPPYEGNPGRALSASEKRNLIAEVAAPDKRPAGAPLERITTPSTPLPSGMERQVSDAVVVGRQRQQRLDVTLAFGSITEVEADAYVFGIFNLVQPAGAASAIDDRMGGAIRQMFERRMFNAGVGEISILPTGKHPVRADVIAFAGLGPFDNFNEDVLEIVGENVVRTFINTRVDEFATVPIGGGTNAFTASALRKLLVGFLRGLQDSGLNNRFRGVTICETDKDRYDAMQAEFYRLCGTSLFDGIEVTLHQVTLPEPPSMTMRREAVVGAAQSSYLIVRQESAQNADPIEFGCSVLTAGAKATVFKARQTIAKKVLEDHLALLGKDEVLTPKGLPQFGTRLAEIILPSSIRTILERELERPMVVVHDAATSRIPWETLRIKDKFPALECGLSHRYEADDLAIAKWLESRQHGKSLDILLIVDPTEDLPGALAEGQRVLGLLEKLRPAVTIEKLFQQTARKDTILRHFASGKFDVVHYAGHAYFDPNNRAKSGILCAGKEVLSGADLANIGGLPSLVFFNACESGRLRRGAKTAQIDDGKHPIDRVQRGVSFAEAFLRGGIANYLGTYWPVNDDAALAFSETFYQQVLAGKSLGSAIMAARKSVEAQHSADWADYILYGNPDFVLKMQM